MLARRGLLVAAIAVAAGLGSHCAHGQACGGLSKDIFRAARRRVEDLTECIDEGGRCGFGIDFAQNLGGGVFHIPADETCEVLCGVLSLECESSYRFDATPCDSVFKTPEPC